MAYKIDKLHAVKIGVITSYKTAERQPLRAVPARLSAMAVFETLNKLGFILPLHAAAETEKSLRYGQAQAISPLAIENQDLSDALASINLPISERIRFRFACERLGLLC